MKLPLIPPEESATASFSCALTNPVETVNPPAVSVPGIVRFPDVSYVAVLPPAVCNVMLELFATVTFELPAII